VYLIHQLWARPTQCYEVVVRVQLGKNGGSVRLSGQLLRHLRSHERKKGRLQQELAGGCIGLLKHFTSEVVEY